MKDTHDASYKLLFSHPEMVRDLVRGFIPDPWLHGLDFSTLQKVPSSFVTNDHRHRADDVIWRVRVQEQWMYLYLLIEFQSRTDHWMAVRVMTYVGLLYQDLIRRDDVARGGDGKSAPRGRYLPPVLPIVLYNGQARWTAATDVFDLLPRLPGLAGHYLPRLKYLLIDESSYTEQKLAGLQNLVAQVIRIGHPQSKDTILQAIEQLTLWLHDKPELKRTLALWIRVILLQRSRHTLVLPKLNDLKELKMTLAERFDQWALEYEQKGIQKGKQEGLREGLQKGIATGEGLLLQRQLARRFGPLPDAVLQRIAAASITELELWGDRVLDAASLDDVFRPHA